MSLVYEIVRVVSEKGEIIIRVIFDMIRQQRIVIK